jgi:hypothetical protein
MPRRSLVVAWSALLLSLLAGCGQGRPNLSPTPEQDPARHARAVAQTEQVARRNREAEAKFWSTMRHVTPPDEGVAVPAASYDQASSNP